MVSSAALLIIASVLSQGTCGYSVHRPMADPVLGKVTCLATRANNRAPGETLGEIPFVGMDGDHLAGSDQG